MRSPKARSFIIPFITNLCNNFNLRITPQFTLVQGQVFDFNAKGTRLESCMISTASQDFLGPEGFKGLLLPFFGSPPTPQHHHTPEI